MITTTNSDNRAFVANTSTELCDTSNGISEFGIGVSLEEGSPAIWLECGGDLEIN